MFKISASQLYDGSVTRFLVVISFGIPAVETNAFFFSTLLLLETFSYFYRCQISPDLGFVIISWVGSPLALW